MADDDDDDHVEQYGKRFKKPDVERIGVFAEMPYMHGEGYVSLYPPPYYIEGTNFIGVGPKMKVGKADCYFDKEFRRIFEGEAIKKNTLQKVPVYKQVKTIPFLSVGPTKLHSTPGDWHGTFISYHAYMSPKPKKTKKPPEEPRNFITKPGRKGTSGYVNICMNPYPPHPENLYGDKGHFKVYGKILKGPMITSHYPDKYFQPNPYKLPPSIPFGKTYVKPVNTERPFLKPGIIKPLGPGKKLGGCKCGGFSKYPPHSADKHATIWDLENHKKLVGKKWNIHSTGLKTMFTRSVVDDNVQLRLNERTIGTFEPTYIKNLID